MKHTIKVSLLQLQYRWSTQYQYPNFTFPKNAKHTLPISQPHLLHIPAHSYISFKPNQEWYLTKKTFNSLEKYHNPIRTQSNVNATHLVQMHQSKIVIILPLATMSYISKYSKITLKRMVTQSNFPNLAFNTNDARHHNIPASKFKTTNKIKMS